MTPEKTLIVMIPAKTMKEMIPAKVEKMSLQDGEWVLPLSIFWSIQLDKNSFRMTLFSFDMIDQNIESGSANSWSQRNIFSTIDNDEYDPRKDSNRNDPRKNNDQYDPRKDADRNDPRKDNERDDPRKDDDLYDPRKDPNRYNPKNPENFENLEQGILP